MKLYEDTLKALMHASAEMQSFQAKMKDVEYLPPAEREWLKTIRTQLAGAMKVAADLNLKLDFLIK